MRFVGKSREEMRKILVENDFGEQFYITLCVAPKEGEKEEAAVNRFLDLNVPTAQWWEFADDKDKSQATENFMDAEEWNLF